MFDRLWFAAVFHVCSQDVEKRERKKNPNYIQNMRSVKTCDIFDISVFSSFSLIRVKDSLVILSSISTS